MKLFNLVILFFFLAFLGAGKSFCPLKSNFLNKEKEKRINTRLKKPQQIQKFQGEKNSIIEFRT